MKKLLLLSLIAFSIIATAQNVGIGTNDPRSKLDINGGLSLREGPVFTLANGGASGGVNDNLTLPDITTGVKASFYRIAGPTLPFSIFGITPVGNADGQMVTLVNTTSEIMTIKNNASSTATNGFKISGGNDLVSVAGGSSVTIQYNKTEGRWYVTGSQNFIVPSNGVANISVSSPITTTGGANPTIGLGVVPVDKGGTGLTAVGAGQILIGTSSGGYLNTTLSSGTGINVVSSSGSVTIENTGDTNAADDITTSSTAAGDISGTFSNLQINNAVVGSTEIADGSVTAVDLNQMGATNGQVLQWNGVAWVPATPNNGTVTAVTASNGLTSSGGATPDIKLGGTLATGTDVALNGNNLAFSGIGNVGVGTGSPGAKLTVVQNSGHEVAHFVQGTPASYNTDVWWKGGATADWLFSKRTTDGTGDFWIYNPGLLYAPLTIRQSGTVGIGTATPYGKLHVITSSNDGNTGAWTDGNFVVGQAAASGASSGAIALSYSTGNNTGYISSLSPTTAWRDLGLRAANTVFYYNGASEGMRLNTSGNLGIGTNSPQAKLHVEAGKIYGSKTTFPNPSSYTNADLVLGSNTDTRDGYGQTNGSHIFLRSSDKSTITALDESNNLGQISYQNLKWTIGEDVGWNPQTIRFPAYTNGLLKVDGSGNVGVAAGGDVPAGSNNYIQNQTSANQTAGFRINGIGNINNGNTYAIQNGHMAAGSLTIGGNADYGGGTGWNANTAGLMLEALDNTEIAIHDNGARIASSMFYEGASNRITVGRDMGWGALSTVYTPANVGIGSAASSPLGALDISLPSGAGSWNRFVVKTTSLWGDGLSSPSETGGTQYVTIGAQAEGIMISNPHVVWNQGNSAAAIRYGRGGGIASGDWWEAGVNGSSGFHIRKTAATSTGIEITNGGNVGIGMSPGTKLDVAGTAAVDYLRVDPQDGTTEGGEIQLVGTGSYGNLQLDNYAGHARIHTLAPGKVFDVLGGNGIKATGAQFTNLGGSGTRLVTADASGNLSTNAVVNKTDVLYVRGTGLNNNANRVVRIGNTEHINSGARGLTLTRIDKATHTVLSSINYDTYGYASECDNLAAALNAMNNSMIGILTSYDAWEGQLNLNLKTAFARLGLYKAAGTTAGGARRPYAAIFEMSSDPLVKTASVSEIEHSAESQQPYAELRGWLIDGGFVATTQDPSGLSTPTGELAAVTNESGQLAVINLIGSGDRPVYADANGILKTGTNYGIVDVAAQGDSRVTFAGTWNYGTGAWGVNRLSNSYAYNTCSGSTTSCLLDYVVLSLDNNQYKSVFVSDLDWSNCGTAAVYLSFDGGATYNFSSRFSTWRNIDNTGAPYTSTIRCIADNLPIGNNIRVKVVAERGRFHFEGFGLSREINGQEGMSTIFPHAVNLLDDVGGYPTGNYYFTTQGGTILLNVSGTGYGTGSQQIGVDIYVDGTRYGRARSFTNEAYSHKTFSASFVVINGLAAGEHYVSFGNYNSTNFDSNDIFNASIIELSPY